MERPDRGPTDNPVIKRVREVADDLLNGNLRNHPGERRGLREALDQAEAPSSGRERSNEALGNISQRGGV